MQKPPHQHFGLSILTPNPRHIITPRFPAVYIRHNSITVKLPNCAD